jgi:pSer/pThr/pTyr-binding forkhead associated (FHA) protein
MIHLDFPTWFGIGSYGGLAASLLTATALVAYAQWTRRGTPRQLARAILFCLVASCLMLSAIWWNQNRLDLYGPSLDDSEVTFWLVWTALLGWLVPFSMLVGYVALAKPQPLALAHPQGDAAGPRLEDPARRIEPLGTGRPWGRLIPLDGPFAEHALSLTRKLTLIGREIDNDVVLDDELASRRHAEVWWEQGRAQVHDLGSMNGTFVNGQSARGPLPLRSGDVIQLGARTYRVELLTSGALRRALLADDEDETRKLPGATLVHRVEVPLLLVGLSPSIEGRRWQLDQSLTTLGRDATAAIVLPDESVSRLHAQILRQQTGLYLTDLDSSNGTYLNGVRIGAPALIGNGDELRFGAVLLRCELVPFTAPPTTPLDEQLRAALTAASAVSAASAATVVGAAGAAGAAGPDTSIASRETPPLLRPRRDQPPPPPAVSTGAEAED